MKNELRALLATVVVSGLACGGGEPQSVVAPVATANATASAIASASAASTDVPPTTNATNATNAAPHRPDHLRDNTRSDSAAAIARKYGGATVTFAQRKRLMTDFGARWTQLAASSRADRDRDAVAWLKARPEIEDAGAIANLDVWARFKDGKLVLVPTYDWTKKPAAKHTRVERDGASLGAKEGPLPDSKALAVVDAIHYDAALSAQLQGWAGAKGYVASGADGSVAGLRSGVKNAGVFYMNSHGGGGYERELGDVDQRSTIYALMTTTPVTDASNVRVTNNSTTQAMANDTSAAQYEGELSRGELVYFYAAVPGPTPSDEAHNEWHYGITHRFVAKNFTFAKDAFVFLNAC
ncbi:MAG TPA: hypothetical protein VGH87_22985, partial [Polyangiaceae bacterium]